jgi:hypothetical protein
MTDIKKEDEHSKPSKPRTWRESVTVKPLPWTPNHDQLRFTIHRTNHQPITSGL